MQKICETKYWNCFVYYRWNINGTYKINENMQNGAVSELHTDNKKS